MKFFSHVITYEDVKNHKPYPDAYNLAIKLSKQSYLNCIAIEDSERGVIAAKNANLFCLAIPNELTCKSDFSRADRILKNINEILDCFG